MRAFVTGGTGFIGGRLVQTLIREMKAETIVSAHRTSPGALRAARDGAVLDFTSLTDADGLVAAARDCDVVYHLAFGKAADAKERRAVTIDSTHNLVAAALKNRVRRFVYVSTCAVYYQRQTEAFVNETSPSGAWGWNYSDEKFAAEEVVRAAIRDEGLPGVVLQVVGVYGPWGETFTIAPLTQMRSGKIVLPNDRPSLANATYVDDVVQGLVLALDEKAVGETFILRSQDAVTRRDFLAEYEKMLGVSGVVEMSVAEIRERAPKTSWRSFGKVVPAALRALSSSSDFKDTVRNTPIAPLARPLYRASPFGAARFSRSAPPKPTQSDAAAGQLIFPPETILNFVAARLEFSPNKAIETLGFRPRYSLEEGMGLTAEWARWARLAPVVAR